MPSAWASRNCTSCAGAWGAAPCAASRSCSTTSRSRRRRARRGFPHPLVLFLFVLGTVLMRCAGCALNDFADRKFDSRVERTRERPLAAGTIRPWEALAVAAVCAAAAFAIVLQFNPLTIELSFAALAIAVIYPFLKRFFWLPQAWLGVAFGFGIPMAFAALTGVVGPVAWALLCPDVLLTPPRHTQD